MKKLFSILILLALAFPALGAVVVVPGSSFPVTTVPQSTDRIFLIRPGVTNLTIPWAAAFSNSTPIVYMTTINATTNINTYEYTTYVITTNLISQTITVLSNAYFYETNIVNNEIVTNLTTQVLNVTSNAYFFQTNFVNYDVVTNLYSYTNYFEYVTNNFSYITNLFNSYFTNNYSYITNLYSETVTNVNLSVKNLTVYTNVTLVNGAGDTMTNSSGYQFGSMIDSNAVLSLIAQVGAYEYMGGPTNTFAITNSTEAISRTNVFTASISPFINATTSSAPVLTVGQYARTVISTNKFARIDNGPVAIETYPFRTGGAGTVSGHYEFYAVDAVSNIMYELASTPTSIISATAPTLLITSMYITNGFTATNLCYAAIAFKVDSAGVGGPTLSWAHGGIYPAHFNFVRPLSSATINSTQIVGTITNTLASVTNAWAGPTNSLSALANDNYYTTVTPCSVTGFTDTGAYNAHSIQLSIFNSAASNITVYTPLGVVGTNGLVQPTAVVSNGMEMILWFKVRVGSRTNMVNLGF